MFHYRLRSPAPACRQFGQSAKSRATAKIRKGWERALEATRRGNFAATSFWYFSEDRETDFIHVGPLIADRLVIFTRDDSSAVTYETLSDLEGYSIGIVPGYTHAPEFWALVEDGTLTVSEGPSDLANIRKLVAGRIDLIPASEEAGWHMASENLTEEEHATLAVLDVPLVVTHGYLPIPARHHGRRNTDGP